jgi:hypothetical protein
MAAVSKQHRLTRRALPLGIWLLVAMGCRTPAANSEDAADALPDVTSDVQLAALEVAIDIAIDATAAEVLTSVDVTTTDAVTALPDASTCVASYEFCDGVDNDCNGLTDEGYLGLTGKGWQPIGAPCGEGLVAAFGTIVCKNKQTAACNLSHYDLDVVLAPEDAKLSPLTAKGGFVDVSAQLPIGQIAVDVGTPTYVPPGSSPLALDVDGDGDVDLVWVDGMVDAQLWTQTAPWQFTVTPLYKNPQGVMAAAALMDGAKTQLLLGGQTIALLERDAAGQFVDVAAARGLTTPPGTQHIQHLLPADVNGDGLLDIVAGVFACSVLYPALYVWIDRGDGHFQESSLALGFDLHASVWANLFTDLDGNGLPALMVLTEGCEPHPGNGLYRQQALGTGGPLYQIQQMLPIFTAPSAPTSTPMGGCTADVNGDGVQDYLLSEIELRDYVNSGGDVQNMSESDPKIAGALSNHLLLSQPSGSRKQAGLQAGLWAPLSTTGVPMTSWTPIWSDLDHDGHLDLLLSHATEYLGWTSGKAGTMRPVFFRNDGQQHFDDASAAIALPKQHDGRAMVAADLDGDGDMDLALGGHGVAPQVLRNDIQHGGSDVRVQLTGHASNPWGLLAQIKLTTNTRTLTMEHNVQGTPQSMAMPLSHFALAAGEMPQKLTVLWPSGWQSQQPLTKPGMVKVVEPQLFALSTRWSPGGTTPVQVQATQFGPDGQPDGTAQCSIELAAGAQGKWQAPLTCQGATCTRTWLGTSATENGVDTLVIGCGGQTWHVRPRISY